MAKKIAPSGLWIRGGVYWFAYTPPGLKRIRVSLKTGDLQTAVTESKKIRENPYLAKGGKWSDEIDDYIKDMLARSEFTQSSADSSRSLLESAAPRIQGKPSELDLPKCQAFYDSLKKEGLRPVIVYKMKTYVRDFKVPRPLPAPKADKPAPGLTDYTRATYLARLSSFCDWLIEEKKLRENPCKKVKKAKVRDVARERACTVAEVVTLLENCKRADIKFVLLCGFGLGMRKQEIVNSRPSWFDLGGNPRLHIPSVSKHPVTKKEFRVKNGKARFLKLSPPFVQFLQEGFGEWQAQDYMIHPEAVGVRYRWDPRRPFEDYMKAQGFPWVKMHVMRHTFCTNLAPFLSSVQLAAAVGDSVRTIEKHYYHAPPEGVETAPAMEIDYLGRIEAAKENRLVAALAASQGTPANSTYV